MSEQARRSNEGRDTIKEYALEIVDDVLDGFDLTGWTGHERDQLLDALAEAVIRTAPDVAREMALRYRALHA